MDNRNNVNDGVEQQGFASSFGVLDESSLGGDEDEEDDPSNSFEPPTPLDTIHDDNAVARRSVPDEEDEDQQQGSLHGRHHALADIRHHDGRAAPASTVDACVAAAWDPILKNALAKSRDERYATVKDFAQAVKDGPGK